MTPPLALVECSNCDCWFMDGVADELFHHATGRCRETKETAAFTEPSPSGNGFPKS